MKDDTNNVQKVVIIGSGPAGYTAAIYAARARLEPVMFEGFHSGPAGGQLMTTTDVENFPGFPAGITGPELMESFKKQAERFGTRCLMQDVASVDFTKTPFEIKGTKDHFLAHSVIICTGAMAKRLDIPGTRDGEFWQKGVSACAVCDGAIPIFRNKELYVIGGGDAACEEAMFLTKYASKVYLVHRRDELRASKIMAERAMKHPGLEIVWDSVIERVEGTSIVESVTIRNLKTNDQRTRPAGGLFFAVGHVPNTAFLSDQLQLNDVGYIVVKPGTTQTSVSGVFAGGDVQDFVYRQAVTAAGTGCMAALEAERYLVTKEIH